MTLSTSLLNWRLHLGLTTEQAANFVHVQRRTWEAWENADREIPLAKLELLGAKIQAAKQNGSLRDLVVVVSDACMPIDVVAADTFIGLREHPDGTAVISSLAVDRVTGRPHVKRCTFNVSDNLPVVKKVRSWKSIVDEDMQK
jgi:DNA-binding XRE family transcriptional regulator